MHRARGKGLDRIYNSLEESTAVKTRYGVFKKPFGFKFVNSLILQYE
jgi:hypothetical protein